MHAVGVSFFGLVVLVHLRGRDVGEVLRNKDLSENSSGFGRMKWASARGRLQAIYLFPSTAREGETLGCILRVPIFARVKMCYAPAVNETGL
ncbi:hypothetical protein EVAR_62586_1 [Eumeta japonica]|uniref:Secreted protein n=1 Tax=Eumeta variegata TaxID=151549 RepID=A0A4C1Y8V1_EUMVA|nr:hypothetical protein EVAR_62586_1 [Eumeta japonica]